MCCEGIYEFDDMQRVIDELGGISVRDSLMRCVVDVLDADGEELISVSYDEIEGLGGKVEVSDKKLQEFVRKHYSQEITDKLMEKAYS